MLLEAADSHPSAARFVGTLLTCKTHCPKKDTTAELPKLLHETFTLARANNLDLQKRRIIKDLLQTKTFDQSNDADLETRHNQKGNFAT